MPRSSRGLSLPLALVGFLAVGSAAYFVGRGAGTPGGAPTATASAEHEGEEAGHAEHGEEAGHAEEGHAGEAGHAEHGEEGAEHAGENLIRLSPAATRTAGIRVQPVRAVVLSEPLTVPGTVEVSPTQGARITPPVPAKVIRLLVNRGDRVRAGQALVILDSVEVAGAHAAVRQATASVEQAQAQVRTTQAGVQQANTRLSSARAALARQQQFARTGAFSQPALQAAQNELNEAQSEEQQAQTALGAATTVLQRTERLFKEELVARAELEQAQTARQQAQTRLDQSRQRVGIARQSLEREQRVFRGGLLSKQAIQTAEAEVRAGQAEVRQAQSQEQAARTALKGARTGLYVARDTLEAVEGGGHSEGGAGRLTLYAPISGTVIDLHATQGQAVERGTELFEIENLDTVLVSANVPEADVGRIRVGQRADVKVTSYPNVRFTGTVQSIGSRVDEKTRTLPVRVLVQNPGGRLRPQMFARVALAVGGRGRSALALPESAIGEDGKERFVFVQEAGGYERRDVALGQTSGGMVEVRSGIKAGEPVVVDGVFILKSEGVKAELKGHDH